MELTNTTHSKKNITAIVIVAALGYFVDIYDLLLFSIVREGSLTGLGYSGEELTSKGLLLLDLQMAGMLIGGIFWGVLGDKKGRLTVLFGSILTYSVANIANGFVNSIEAYSFWRIIAGIGLAGELGAGITLVAEVLPKEKRGIGTTIVASIGISGAVVAYFVGEMFDWRTSFFIGGGLGLLLLLLRIGVSESGMFSQAKQSHTSRGNFFSLFTDRKRLTKYIRCILIGVPLWYVVGILITLSPEFGKILNIQGKVSGGAAVAACYGGIVLGDIASGLISQLLKSRKKVVLMFLILHIAAIAVYFLSDGLTLPMFYTVCFFLGFSVGYWVIFMTVAAEQFGTNIRATVTTTVPNFVRAAVIPLSILFHLLQDKLGQTFTSAALYIGIGCLVLAFISLFGLKETFSKDLDYVEEI